MNKIKIYFNSSFKLQGKGNLNTFFVVSREGYTAAFPNFDELCAEDGIQCKKLPMTKGKIQRASMESGFYDMNGGGVGVGVGGTGGIDTLSTGDVALSSRKTSQVVDTQVGGGGDQ